MVVEPNPRGDETVLSQIQQLRVTMEENHKAFALQQTAFVQQLEEWKQRMANPGFVSSNQTDGGIDYTNKNLLKDSGDDPLAELKELREINGIMEYHHRFESISARLDLPEDCLISAFLDGLKLDTQTHIKMFQPKSVRDCLLLGKLYEKAQSYLKKASNQIKQDTEKNKVIQEEEIREANEEELIQEVKEEDEEELIQEEKIREVDEEEPIPQFQVPVFNLESYNASPVVCEDFPSVVGCDDSFDHQREKLKVSRVESIKTLAKNRTDDAKLRTAHQLFVEMTLGPESYRRKKLSFFLRCWKFKFKNRVSLTGEYKPKSAMEHFRVNAFGDDDVAESIVIDSGYHETLSQWLLIRCKFWKFNFVTSKLQTMMREHGYSTFLKLMSDMKEHDEMFTVARANSVRSLLCILLGISKSDASHGQQAVYEQIIMSLFSKNWRFKFKNQHRTQRSFEVGDWVYVKL